MTKIKDIEELKALATKEEDDGPLECFIALAGGVARSSKDIYYDASKEKPWEVYHDVDDHRAWYTDEELRTQTNIVEAIERGALYMY